VANAARELGLTGFAKNLPDGLIVEVVAEGEAGKLDELERRLKIGPSAARVDSVKSTTREHKDGYKGFLIL
jgi:acylphosphatase